MPRGPLPGEITDKIIDELRYSRITLRSCSLTARSWRVRSQLHLFEFILISTRAAAVALANALTSTPRLTANVRYVKFRIPPSALVLNCQLPNVNALVIHGYRQHYQWGHDLSITDVFSLRNIFPNVSTVTIDSNRFDNPQTLWSVYALPHLARIRLRNVDFKEPGNGILQPFDFAAPKILTTLVLDDWVRVSEAWCAAPARPYLSTLRRLEFRWTRGADHIKEIEADSICRIAATALETLEELHVEGVTSRDISSASTSNHY